MTQDEEFFGRYGDYLVRIGYYEADASFTVEDMYQMFKARLAREAMAPDAAKGSADE